MRLIDLVDKEGQVQFAFQSFAIGDSVDKQAVS